MTEQNLEQRILVVEDRPEYRAAAQAFFQTLLLLFGRSRMILGHPYKYKEF